MPVEIIYKPIKFGFKGTRIFVEAHEDIYHQIPDLLRYGFAQLERMGLEERVNLQRFAVALVERKGMPVDITMEEKGFADKPILLRRKLIGKPPISTNP